MPDQARGDAVEHLAQREAARGGHAHAHLLVVDAASLRQTLEDGPLGIDALGQDTSGELPVGRTELVEEYFQELETSDAGDYR